MEVNEQSNTQIQCQWSAIVVTCQTLEWSHGVQKGLKICCHSRLGDIQLYLMIREL